MTAIEMDTTDDTVRTLLSVLKSKGGRAYGYELREAVGEKKARWGIEKLRRYLRTHGYSLPCRRLEYREGKFHLPLFQYFIKRSEG